MFRIHMTAYLLDQNLKRSPKLPKKLYFSGQKFNCISFWKSSRSSPGNCPEINEHFMKIYDLGCLCVPNRASGPRLGSQAAPEIETKSDSGGLGGSRGPRGAWLVNPFWTLGPFWIEKGRQKGPFGTRLGSLGRLLGAPGVRFGGKNLDKTSFRRIFSAAHDFSSNFQRFRDNFPANFETISKTKCSKISVQKIVVFPEVWENI